MLIGQWMILVAVFLILTTVKRPVWLGGPRRRYTADDTSNAMLSRASRRSLAGYIAFGGALFWLLGL